MHHRCCTARSGVTRRLPDGGSGVVMLSLWKLRVGAEAYYLSQVARGIDDYYSGSGESEGRWLGTGSAILNLADAVTGDDLRAILAGLAPGAELVERWKVEPHVADGRAAVDRFLAAHLV